MFEKWIAKIPAPRSWSKEEQRLFETLPHEIKCIIGKREADRDREIRRVQNEFAQLKKEYANGIQAGTVAKNAVAQRENRIAAG